MKDKCYDCAKEKEVVYTDPIDGAKFCDKCQSARTTEQGEGNGRKHG